MALTIRPFVANDRLSLIEAINTVCGESQWMCTTHFEPTPAWMYALETPDSPDYLLSVVEIAGEIVGWCRIFPKDNQTNREEATLGIGLLPKYRNQGIGTDLIRRALKWAREAGYHRIQLVTHQDNARAVHVFTKCGFTLARDTDTNRLEMICELAGSSDKQGDNNCEC